MNHRAFECPPAPASQKYANIFGLGGVGITVDQQYQEKPECSHLVKFLKFDI